MLIFLSDEYIENNACKSCGDTLQFKGYVCNGVTKTACKADEFVLYNECIKCPSGQVVNGFCKCGKTKLESACPTPPPCPDGEECGGCMLHPPFPGIGPPLKETYMKLETPIIINHKGVSVNAGCFTEECCFCGESVDKWYCSS